MPASANARAAVLPSSVSPSGSGMNGLGAASAPALGRFGRLYGSSTVMQDVYRMIEKVAPTEATVFITGESGCGKELVARTIHERSPRGRGGFVAINCGAIPP